MSVRQQIKLLECRALLLLFIVFSILFSACGGGSGSDGNNSNSSGFGYVDTGNRYSPITDAWIPTSTINAPSGRADHIAVWTGSEMIIWGGYAYDKNISISFNTGSRYNPVTDLWAPTPTINAPSGRVDHLAVWTGSEMIIWGGWCDGC